MEEEIIDANIPQMFDKINGDVNVNLSRQSILNQNKGIKILSSASDLISEEFFCNENFVEPNFSIVNNIRLKHKKKFRGFLPYKSNSQDESYNFLKKKNMRLRNKRNINYLKNILSLKNKENFISDDEKTFININKENLSNILNIRKKNLNLENFIKMTKRKMINNEMTDNTSTIIPRWVDTMV